MLAIIATTSFGPPQVFGLVLSGLIFAELLGVPVAWFHLRKSSAWLNRPPGARRIDLLSRFVWPITGFVGVWALVVSLSAVIANALA
jgi:hypothetical protein